MHLDEEQEAVNVLLRQLDHAPPNIAASDIAARARRQHLGRMRWAAGILLVAVVGSAALAAPGSPLRGWVRDAVKRLSPRTTAPQSVPASTPDASLAGVAVEPGKSLLILFANEQSAGGARVSLSDGAEVVVRAPAGAASFTSDVGRLSIDNGSPTAMFEIQIPRAAPRVEIRVNGVRVFLKTGAVVTARVSTGAPDAYVIPLSRPRS